MANVGYRTLDGARSSDARSRDARSREKAITPVEDRSRAVFLLHWPEWRIDASRRPNGISTNADFMNSSHPKALQQVRRVTKHDRTLHNLSTTYFSNRIPGSAWRFSVTTPEVTRDAVEARRASQSEVWRCTCRADSTFPAARRSSVNEPQHAGCIARYERP